MDYYHCPFEQLRREIERRGYIPCGGHDELSEGLARDDTTRGINATTVETVVKDSVEPRSRKQIAEYGPPIDPTLLVGEKIVYYTMNTFFPTLQMFFESGLSCTISCEQLHNVFVGIDPELRFRLTDLTHEEEGVIVKSPLPQKFIASIRILESVVAERTSVSTKPVASSGKYQNASIVREAHMVVGLRLEGMPNMGYVWAKTNDPSENNENHTWSDASVGGLREDIPAPFFGFPARKTKMGAQVSVVEKGSMIEHHRGREGVFRK
ncbi:hypothetical protein K505DRAFT_308831 [Melanomma pulvis-pyrius CBS 109.77]|uniref:Uncharacterized protein n=1 Tax=Melanomma pulvis-pyrius CBS 109.77 TaxID=1314802 RepID=A0A6A6X6B9_9PLEO|nr:hypothetical protein K505DRAFT_308831 [Melanomma pulvis-pyrius CBS 109.77]